MAIDILNLLDKKTFTPRRDVENDGVAHPNRRHINILDIMRNPVEQKKSETTQKKKKFLWIELSDVDLVDLLDKKKRTPLSNPGHKERRRVTILDIMDPPVPVVH